LKKYDNTIEIFSEVIELNPKCANAYNDRGAANYVLGKCDKSIKDFTKSIELDPNNPGHYYNRGNAYKG